MSDLVLDRAAYAEEIGEPEELLDPIPQCAPARNGVTLFPFKLMLPRLDGVYEATFDCVHDVCVSQGAIRYGDQRPVYLNFSGGYISMLEGDTFTIHLHTGGRR